MTTIEWTHRPGTTGESWNPIRARPLDDLKRVGHFCVRVNEACRNCYAASMNRWRGNGVDYAAQNASKVSLSLDAKAMNQLDRWRSRRTIFVCSMTDLFGEFVPEDMIWSVFNAMLRHPEHTFLVLTKRPALMAAFTAKLPRVYPNIWLGCTVHDQASAEEMIPHLLAALASVHFVSYEPALGLLDLRHVQIRGTHFVLDALMGTVGGSSLRSSRVDWVIFGGESGRGARPCDPAWEESIRRQCRETGTAYFRKQWGEWAACGHERTDREFLDGRCFAAAGRGLVSIAALDLQPGRFRRMPSGAIMQRVGKKAAGSALGGREHRAWPKAT